MKHLGVVWIVVCALVAGGCSELTGGAGQISQRIGEVTSDPAAQEVDLAKLTTFGWDRLYLFKPGTPKKEICAFIGTDGAFCDQVIRHESVAGESMTLVFGLKDELTHAELHAFTNGRFDVRRVKKGFPRSPVSSRFAEFPPRKARLSFGSCPDEA